MNFLTRVKYLFGLLAVVAAVGGLTLNMDDRISTVHDVTASVRADDYTVGSPYSGMVVKRTVDVGDHVDEGERMFVVKSNELARDIANEALEPKKSAYDVRGGNKVVVRATTAGKVAEVRPIEGAFVTANTAMARVEEQGSGYVEADFRLTPKQYAAMRRAEEVTVRLPDERTVRADVERVRVKTEGDQAATRLRAVSPQLDNRGIFSSGTPVDVEVTLREDGLAESLRSLLAGLLTPGGAR